MMIVFRDLTRQYLRYKKEIDDSILNVIESSKFVLGDSVKLLETELAKFVGVKHCITCANGTDAMSLVLMAWGVKQGDAVFVPNYTFFSTAEVVSHIGATPIFIDVNVDTFNMSSTSLEEAIIKVRKETELNPKVIISVDLFGLCADYNAIQGVAEKYGLLLLEDGAQGFGAELQGRKACSFGDAATTSFYPAKPLGCYGDGGAIFTNDDDLATKIKSLRSHGTGLVRYDHVYVGLNSRLDSIQASILMVKFNAMIKHELKDINYFAELYNSKLSKLVKVPKIPNGYYSSYAQYTIRLSSPEQRDGLARFLEGKMIPTMIYYPKTMHQQQVYDSHDYNIVSLENSINLTQVALSLPIHPYLFEDEVAYICDNIKEYFHNN
jgi:UDP-2-acetamido-2-deoxy-ribo-hexuluronate aminotransferase